MEASIKKPSEEEEDYWIFEESSDIAQNCQLGGKWMMFHDHSVFDEKWVEAVKLYRDGEKACPSRMNYRATRKKGPQVVWTCSSWPEAEWVQDNAT